MEKIRLNADNCQVLAMGDWYLKIQYTVLATLLDFYLFFMFLLASLSGFYSNELALTE